MIIVKKPNECSKTDLLDFAAFVCAGSEVTVNGLETRIKKSEALVFFYQNGCLKGISAVKNPDQSYKNGVFKKAQAIDSANEFLFELGWVFVLPSSRGAGFSYKLVESALSVTKDQAIFATTRSDNIPMQKALKFHGFSFHGKEYESDHINRKLVLFLRKATQQNNSAANV